MVSYVPGNQIEFVNSLLFFICKNNVLWQVGLSRVQYKKVKMLSVKLFYVQIAWLNVEHRTSNE